MGTMADKLDAAKLMEFMRKSELINLDAPVSTLLTGVGELLDEDSYVLAWSRYVLVIKDLPPGGASARLAMGEASPGDESDRAAR